jgi:hypothetical protein
VKDARAAAKAGFSDGAAFKLAVKAAVKVGGPNDSLITKKPQRESVAYAAAVAVADHAGTLTGHALDLKVAKAVRDNLAARVSAHAAFPTNNRYNATQVFDLGDTGAKPVWASSIDGRFQLSGYAASAANRNREQKSEPKLLTEVLWGDNPPAGAPLVYVVSQNGWLWQGSKKPVRLTTQITGNDCSLGLLVRFNSFAYSTLGDMGSESEDRLIGAIMGTGTAVSGGGAEAVPDCLAAFKVSHHGSSYSTSQTFLNAAKPAAALISCGYNESYWHPSLPAVTRLQKCKTLKRYYLTNCWFQTAVIPASMGEEQLLVVGNKSRVAGQTDKTGDPDKGGKPDVKRHRGTVRLKITQAQSKAKKRKFTVTYWDSDSAMEKDAADSIAY